MQRVYIASPFRGATKEETRQNIIYARLCMLDSLERGEAPYLSHLLYTQVWTEDPTAREAGLAAGDAWRETADLVAVYMDLGITPGMQRALDNARDGTCVGRNLEPKSLEGVSLHGINFALPMAWRELLAAMRLDGFPELYQ